MQPSPENDEIYGRIEPDQPATVELARDIRCNGIQQPLVVSEDGYLLSGHRRLVAALSVGLTHVPVRVRRGHWRSKDPEEHLRLLVSANNQRVKSYDQVLREKLVTTNGDEARAELLAYRQQKSRVDAEPVTIEGTMRRRQITDAKHLLLDAVKRVVESLRTYWPVTVRQVHYQLLNDPPLIHARKLGSKYKNTLASYRALVDIATRGRLEGAIPWKAISDETRPATTWDVHESPAKFIEQELGSMFKGYYRNYLQSQPNHVELIFEKNTLLPILRPLAGEYCIPCTSGRGFCSLPPRHEMAERFRRSGKPKLVVIVVSDHDPEGMSICESFARSMRDDFGVADIHAVKAALTDSQVREFKLPPLMVAKKDSSRRKQFVERYGEHVYEVEALAPEQLQRVVREVIDSVIDVDAFNHELEAEQKDYAYIKALRETVHVALKDLRV